MTAFGRIKNTSKIAIILHFHTSTYIHVQLEKSAHVIQTLENNESHRRIEIMKVLTS